jgi:hypothetical protein
MDQYRERVLAWNPLATARGTDPVTLPVHAIAIRFRKDCDSLNPDRRNLVVRVGGKIQEVRRI